ncbi:hypothetical protein D3C78_1577230 [compost metagenome]
MGDLFLFGREATLQHKWNFGTVEADAIDAPSQQLLVFRAKTGVEHHLHSLAAFELSRLFDIVFRQSA